MPFIPAIGTKGNHIPPRYHPNSRGKKFFPCALFDPVTEVKPSAHFLAEAPRRTLRCLPGRLAAGDRPSLLATNAQNFLISAFVSTIYNIPPRKMQEGIFLFAAKNGTFCRNSTRRNGLLYPRRADRAARGPAADGKHHDRSCRSSGTASAQMPSIRCMPVTQRSAQRSGRISGRNRTSISN